MESRPPHLRVVRVEWLRLGQLISANSAYASGSSAVLLLNLSIASNRKANSTLEYLSSRGGGLAPPSPKRTSVRSKPLPVLTRTNECFDHLSIHIIPVELIQLCQPEVEAGVVRVWPSVRIATQITKELH